MPTFHDYDWYEQPLYYDIVFDADTAGDADLLEAIYRHHATKPRESLTALEPGCGTGRLSIELARRGHRVVGVDLSQSMLDFARRRVQNESEPVRSRVCLLQQDMAALDVADRSPFDLAYCPVNSFRHLPDDQAAVAHLRAVAQALRPGGVYALAVHLLDPTIRDGESMDDHERWVGERDGVRVVCNIRGGRIDRRQRREHVRARLTVTSKREPDRPQRLETRWWFRTYTLPQWRRVLRAVPALEHVGNYGFDCGPDLQSTHPLDSDRLDHVMVLRRNA